MDNFWGSSGHLRARDTLLAYEQSGLAGPHINLQVRVRLQQRVKLTSIRANTISPIVRYTHTTSNQTEDVAIPVAQHPREGEQWSRPPKPM